MYTFHNVNFDISYKMIAEIETAFTLSMLSLLLSSVLSENYLVWKKAIEQFTQKLKYHKMVS